MGFYGAVSLQHDPIAWLDIEVVRLLLKVLILDDA